MSSELNEQRVNPKGLCQIEIPVRDLERSLEFYLQVFGWKECPIELHGLSVLQVPEGCPWGISLVPRSASKMNETENASGLMIYFRLDKPEQRDHIITHCERYGGQIIREKVRVPSYGLLTHIEDPDGNRWGIVEA